MVVAPLFADCKGTTRGSTKGVVVIAGDNAIACDVVGKGRGGGRRTEAVGRIAAAAMGLDGMPRGTIAGRAGLDARTPARDGDGRTTGATTRGMAGAGRARLARVTLGCAFFFFLGFQIVYRFLFSAERFSFSF